jgi:hypothetical protein
MDPTAAYTSITVLMGDESAVFMGNVAGSIPPSALNGNLRTPPGSAGDSAARSAAMRGRMLSDNSGDWFPSNVLLAFPVHVRYVRVAMHACGRCALLL